MVFLPSASNSSPVSFKLPHHLFIYPPPPKTEKGRLMRGWGVGVRDRKGGRKKKKNLCLITWKLILSAIGVRSSELSAVWGVLETAREAAVALLVAPEEVSR